jgi:hypothetical protein
MARRAPGVVTHGTAKDLADVGVGYTASGASEHSRQSAHNGRPRDEFANDFRPERPANLSHGELIARTAKQIAKLNGDILLEDNRARREKLRHRLDLKKQVFERLQSERR